MLPFQAKVVFISQKDTSFEGKNFKKITVELNDGSTMEFSYIGDFRKVENPELKYKAVIIAGEIRNTKNYGVTVKISDVNKA